MHVMKVGQSFHQYLYRPCEKDALLSIAQDVASSTCAGPGTLVARTSALREHMSAFETSPFSDIITTIILWPHSDQIANG